MTAPKPLSLSTKLGYGAGDAGGNLFFTGVAFWLMNYLTDEVGLSAALAGAAVMIGKFWEWAEGLVPRFSFIEVDYATQERRIRDSGRFYGAICRERRISRGMLERYC